MTDQPRRTFLGAFEPPPADATEAELDAYARAIVEQTRVRLTTTHWADLPLGFDTDGGNPFAKALDMDRRPRRGGVDRPRG